jgi:uncharacterized protein (DUF433 family)
MGRYALSLPAQLKHDAEKWASRQGVSLNQFILWAVAEKVGALNQQLDEPAFPRITYRHGASGDPVPVLRGTGIRVQTIVVAAKHWEMKPPQIAAYYGISEAQVDEALAFYAVHSQEIDSSIAMEETLEVEAGRA